MAAAIFVLCGCEESAPKNAASEAKSKTSDSEVPATRMDPKLAAIRFEQIAKIEDQSCLCTMAGRDTSALDLELERLIASLEKQQSATSSVPMQGRTTCYPQLGERACVGRIVVTHSRSDNDFVCTQKQMDELLAVWDAAAPGDSMSPGFNETLKKRDAALLTRLRAMHAEAAKSIPQSACN